MWTSLFVKYELYPIYWNLLFYKLFHSVCCSNCCSISCSNFWWTRDTEQCKNIPLFWSKGYFLTNLSKGGNVVSRKCSKSLIWKFPFHSQNKTFYLKLQISNSQLLGSRIMNRFEYPAEFIPLLNGS